MKMKNCGQKPFMAFVFSFFLGALTLSANVGQDNLIQKKETGKANTKAEVSSWKEMGPSNIGGRVKALLWNKKDANILYAGGVAGGLFISENQGKSWTRIEDMEALPISCIYQTEDGTIYVGTGEWSVDILENSFNNTQRSHSIGDGIYKSTDGKVFQQLEATAVENPFDPGDTWAYVNGIAYNEATGTLYAATKKGLFYSENKGDTWVTTASPVQDLCKEVKVNFDGVIYFTQYSSTGGFILKKTGNKDLSGAETIFSTTTNGVSTAFIKDIGIGLTNLDAGYIYLNVAGGLINSSPVDGVFLSKDGGTNWLEITPDNMSVFGDLTGTNRNYYGGYSGAITVSPTDKTKVIVGGYSLYQGKEENADEIYGWSPASGASSNLAYKNNSTYISLYLHENIHAVIYHPSIDSIYAVATDGGVFLYHYREIDRKIGYEMMSNGLNVTQLYSVAVANDGSVFGGAHGNHVVYIQKSSIDTVQNTRADLLYWNGNGNNGGTAFSSIFQRSLPTERSPIFITQPRNNLARTSSSYYDMTTLDRTLIAKDSMFIDNSEASTIDDITVGLLWETVTDKNIPNTIQADLVKKMTIRRSDGSSSALVEGATISVGDTIMLRDKTKLDYPFDYVFKEEINFVNDTIINVKSPIQSRYFMVTNDSIAMCEDMLDYSTPALNKKWAPVFKPTGSEKGNTCLTISKDGNYLFVGVNTTGQTEKSRLYRVSGLTDVAIKTVSDTSNVIVPILSSLPKNQIAKFDRVLTSISVDPNNANNLLVTFGNIEGLFDTSHVVLVTNALSNNPVALDKWGYLPSGIPIYTGVITMNDSNVAYIGTEKGVYKTTNLFDSDNSAFQWEPMGEKIPVYQVFQQQQNMPATTVHYAGNSQSYSFKETYKPGAIYFATHGRGIFMDESYIVPNKAPRNLSVKEISSSLKGEKFGLKVYPNPIENQSTIAYILPNSTNVLMKIFSADGKVLVQKSLGYKKAATYTENLKSENLKRGIIIIQLITDQGSQTIKAVVK